MSMTQVKQAISNLDSQSNSSITLKISDTNEKSNQILIVTLHYRFAQLDPEKTALVEKYGMEPLV